jgi:hypothetical protein
MGDRVSTQTALADSAVALTASLPIRALSISRSRSRRSPAGHQLTLMQGAAALGEVDTPHEPLDAAPI